MKSRRLLAAAEAVVLLLTAAFLFQVLGGGHETSSRIRDYMVENCKEETGALNLVTGIYLGYRAFDTLGETVVLLVAVSGVLFFLVPTLGNDDDEENLDP